MSLSKQTSKYIHIHASVGEKIDIYMWTIFNHKKLKALVEYINSGMAFKPAFKKAKEAN